MNSQFIGTGVALVTPFNSDKSIDYHSFSNLIEFVIKGNVDFLVPMGSTGEASTLSLDEQHEILRFVVEINKGRKPIVAGNFGGNNTQALIKKLNNFDLDGVDAILSASPHYNKPSQLGIIAHFNALNAATKRPIIIYNVPGRTASNIEAETCLKLANECSNIIAIKEASADMHQIKQIIEANTPNFLILSGDDPTALETTNLGGHGVISVIANVFPSKFSTCIKLGLEKRNEEAEILNATLDPFHKWLYIDGNPAGIKQALFFKELIKNELRLPLVPMQNTNANSLKALMDL